MEPGLAPERVLLPIPPRTPAHPRRPRVPWLGSSPATRGRPRPPNPRGAAAPRRGSVRRRPGGSAPPEPLRHVSGGRPFFLAGDRWHRPQPIQIVAGAGNRPRFRWTRLARHFL